MYSGRRGDDIRMQPVNGYGVQPHAPFERYRTEAIDIEIDEKPYFSSDGNLASGDYDEGDGPNYDSDGRDPIDDLPSRKITSLQYESIGGGVRNRRLTSTALGRAKTKVRRATRIHGTWRNNPEGFNRELLSTWRSEDEEEGEDIGDEVRTARRIEELRDMTINLSRKIAIRDSLRKETLRHGTMKQREISCWRNMKYVWAIKREHAKSSVSAAFRSMGLWEDHLKAFASHFGTDVTAYFLFLRWLFVANVLIGLPLLLFLFIPQVLVKFLGYEKTDTAVMIAIKSTVAYESHPLEGGREFITGKGANSSGFFADTGMYYGDYTSLLVSSRAPSGTLYEYDMRLAYLLTCGAYFLIYFLVIAISVAKSYRKNFIESSDKFTFQYVLKVLDGWDYMIDSAKTAHTKRKNMFRDFREFCASNRQPEAVGNCCDSLMMLMFRAGAFFIMLVIITLCGVAVYFTKIELETNVLLQDVLLPAIITAINIFVPFLFTLISAYLKFTYPKSVVYCKLTMTMLLYGVTLGIYFVKTMFPCSDEDVRSVYEGASTASTNCLKANAVCWETRLGEKVYSLVVMDFLMGIVVTFLSEVCYRLITQCCCKRLEERRKKVGDSILPQFDIARNTMAIIYHQFLIWLGIYYSPLLTVVGVIKLWLIFYIKRVTVMNSCIPTTKPWRAAKMHTVFLALLFIGFIYCAVFFAMALAIVKPSDTCGPFSNNYTVVTDVFADASFSTDNYVMNILLSPGVVVGIIVVLCVIVHYVRVTSAGRKTLISLLKIQITLESKDKAYLRHMLDNIIKPKRSTQQAPQCSCEGACNCEETCNPNAETGDEITPLRVRPKGRRIFAKERSNTSMSLLSGTSTGFGSREDLSSRATGDRGARTLLSSSGSTDTNGLTDSSEAPPESGRESRTSGYPGGKNYGYTDPAERF